MSDGLPAIPLGRQLDSDRVRRRRRNGRVYLRRAGEPHVAHNGRGHEDLRIELCAHSLATASIVRSEGVDQRYYLYEPDGRLLQSIEAADDSSTFYHFDHTGSTIMLTDGGGAMTDAYAVAPFGEDVQQQGDSDQPFVYHGAFGVMWERGTSLYNMRRRYYDAATGRFLTRDLILVAGPAGSQSLSVRLQSTPAIRGSLGPEPCTSSTAGTRRGRE